VLGVDRTTRRLVLLVALFGTAYALLARLALHAFPLTGDEYSYLLQGELFAHGQLHSPAPLHAELLRVDHVLMEGTVRSKYPPGTSALLAVGVRFGVPWLVAPVEGAVTLLAMAAAVRRVLGERHVLMAVGLMGAAPLFAFQAASYFSHTATTLWLTIAFALVAVWSEDGRQWLLVVAGAALGCAFLTRPLDAALFAAALCAFGSIRVLALTAVGAAPFVALLLAYQAAQFGSPFTTGYAAYEPTFHALYPGEPPAISLSNLFDLGQLWSRLDIVRSFIVEWTVPGTPLLALLGWAAIRDQAPRMRRFAAALVALVLAALLATAAGVDAGARARYLSTTLIALVWLGAPGWSAAAELLATRLGRGPRQVLAVAVWILPAVQLYAFLDRRSPALELASGLPDMLTAEGIQEGVVVVRARWPTQYARNGPFFDRPVLYLSAPATMGIEDVAAAFPGHPLYEAHEGRTWTVARVR
jgi:hypothetical protein